MSPSSQRFVIARLVLLVCVSAISTSSATAIAGSTVFGRVFYSTTPLAGVTVEIVAGNATDPPLRTTTTNADGRYAFDSIPAGSYWLKVYGPSVEFITWRAMTFDVADGDVQFDFYLPKTIALISPSNGAEGQSAQPTLTWEPNPEAAQYTVQINKTSNWEPIDQGARTDTASYVVQGPLTPGEQYTWQVDATDANHHDVGTTSVQFTFVVAGSAAGEPQVLQVTTLDDSGPGSLRDVLAQSNLIPGEQTVEFTVTGTVRPLSPLPQIVDRVQLRPGVPFEINGAIAGEGANGLQIAAYGTVIEGLTVTGFSGSGIVVIDGTGNLITRSSIFGNSGRGIELVGNANHRQPAPALLSAVSDAGGTTVRAIVQAQFHVSHTIEFFDNDSCGSDGRGQGARYLGSVQGTPDAISGVVDVQTSFATAIPLGHFLTATATDADSNTSEFSKCMEVTSEPTADVSVAVTAPPGSANVGDPITYRVTIGNTGPSAAVGVVLEDSLPSGVSVTNAFGGAMCSHTQASVHCQVPYLLSGQTTSIAITGTVTTQATPAMTNVVTVNSGNAFDRDLQNNTASVVTSVTLTADLAASLSALTTPVYAGDPLTYNVMVVNHGPSPAPGVVVTLTWSPAVAILSAPGNCSTNGAAFTCTAATLASGASTIFGVTVTAPPSGAIDATAAIHASSVDPDSSNDTASLHTVVVHHPAVISVAESIGVHDAPAVRPSAWITVEEPISVADSLDLRPSAWIDVAERITMVDVEIVRPPALIAVAERIGVGDSIDALAMNTPAGTNVVVNPVDPNTGTTPVSVTFSNVTTSGLTSVTSVASGTAPPSGFRTGTPATYYDIRTTATFSGSITVCIPYTPTSFPYYVPPRLFHFENGAWVEHTTSIDTSAHIICGSVTSLSPFALFQELPVEGRMNGDGRIELADGLIHQFEIEIAERRIGIERGHLNYTLQTPKPGSRRRSERTDHFESIWIGPIAFFRSGASATFSGIGRWNGASGYTFDAAAEDNGEPGRGRDRFTVIIRDPHGAVVATVSGLLSGGNIESQKVKTGSAARAVEKGDWR